MGRRKYLNRFAVFFFAFMLFFTLFSTSLHRQTTPNVMVMRAREKEFPVTIYLEYGAEYISKKRELALPAYVLNFIGDFSGEVQLANVFVLEETEEGLFVRERQVIPSLTAVENVELPLIYRGVGKKERVELSEKALDKVGLSKRKTHKPSEMSGGQQQRVAIARAIAQAPPIILADEPTGNLDSNSTKEIMDILRGLHEEGRTVILITHDDEIAARAKRVIKIMDGKIEEDYENVSEGEE